MNLVSNYLEKNIISNTVKINGIQSRMLKLRIKVVAFFFGPPCIVHLQGRIQDFNGGGGGQKIMSANAYLEREARSQPGSRKLSGGYALSCYLSLIFKHSHTRWDKRTQLIKICGRPRLLPLPRGSTADLNVIIRFAREFYK